MASNDRKNVIPPKKKWMERKEEEALFELGEDADPDNLPPVDADVEWVSKTKMKRHLEEIQDLGLRLGEIGKESMAKLGVPDKLAQAVADYKKIKSRPALKRQAQYIGRLMREAGDDFAAKIQEHFDYLDGNSEKAKARQQRLERWRERLIEDDSALEDFARIHGHERLGEIRTLVRNARKEKAKIDETGADKTSPSYRKLFQLIKALDEELESKKDEGDLEDGFQGE